MTKPSKCKKPASAFTPSRPLQNWCGVDCAVKLAEQGPKDQGWIGCK
jgi:hypothetical protein